MNKKKTKKCRRITAVVIIAVLLVGGGFFVWSGTRTVEQEVETVKIEKAVGQEIVFAQISEIKGNEITYIIAEATEQEKKPSGNSTDEQIKDTKTGEKPTGGMPEGFDGREKPDMGEMPEGFGGGEMPDMGEMPEGFGDREMPDMSQMPEGFEGGEMPDMSQMPRDFGGSGGGSENFRRQSQGMTEASDTGMFIYDGTTYRVGTETITTCIPVGTNVTTKLGTVTTFSRLASEDCVALVIEKVGSQDVIVAVYIVG